MAKVAAVIKAEKAWAIYGPVGVFYWTIQSTRRDAVRVFRDNYGDDDWRKFASLGYTVRRVTITPA